MTLTRAEIVETLRADAMSFREDLEWDGFLENERSILLVHTQILEAAARIVERWGDARWLADYTLHERGVETKAQHCARRVLEVPDGE